MMVLRVIVVLVIAVLAVLLGSLITADAGYVVIGLRGWEIETTVWAAIAALLLLTGVGYLLFKLAHTLLLQNSKIADWFATKRSSNSQRQTIQAIEEETNGNTVEAIRLLVAAGNQSPSPLLHYLRASELATRIGADEKASELRRDAARLGDHELHVFQRLEEARELLEQNDKRQGLRELRRLLEQHPRCAPALLVLIQHCHEVEDFVGALEYLDVLSRLSFISDEEIDELKAVSWLGRIRQADPLAIAKVWQGVPRKLKHEPNLLMAYVDALCDKGDTDKAISELERSLGRQWESRCAHTYGLLQGNTEKQLKVAEGWLAEHSDDALLHLTVGRLNRRLSQNELALKRIEQSVKLGGGVAAAIELAELHFESGATQQAKEALASVKQDLANR